MKEKAFPEDSPKTINEMWIRSSVEFAGNRAICYRKSADAESFEQVTYAQLELMVVNFGKGLIELGLKEREPVGIIAENCLRWMICDLAVLGNGAYDIPRGTTSTREENFYILDHSEAKFVILESEEKLRELLEVRKKLHRLKVFIVMDPGFRGTDEKEGIYSFDHVDELGRKAADEVEAVFRKRRGETGPSDTATLLYTSGTTGTPKGIALTHRNLMHNVETVPFMVQVKASDMFLSILPVWHILERTSEYMGFRVGTSLWYTSPLAVLKDLAAVNPTHMISVPRIWISVYNGVKSKLRLSGKEHLFNTFYRHSLRVMNRRRYRQNRMHLHKGEEPVKPDVSLIDYIMHSLGDLLIYSKVRKKVGTNFRAAVSGGGSLPEYIDDFFEVIGLTLLEGYGLTETSPVLCVRTPDHRIPYTVGRPLPGTLVRILDENRQPVPGSEMGAIWVSGPQVMDGYYREPKLTEEVMLTDDDGQKWFDTGDLGCVTKYGDIVIMGRAKDTIVLIGGENVEPEKIETALQASVYIDQVMVCGQDQEYLTALIVPDGEVLRETCRERGIPFPGENIPGLSRNPELMKFFMDIVGSLISPEKGFKEIEFIHNIVFTRPFSTDDETFTNTMKLKRRNIIRRDEALIKGMYPHFNEGGKFKG